MQDQPLLAARLLLPADPERLFHRVLQAGCDCAGVKGLVRRGVELNQQMSPYRDGNRRRPVRDPAAFERSRDQTGQLPVVDALRLLTGAVQQLLGQAHLRKEQGLRFAQACRQDTRRGVLPLDTRKFLCDALGPETVLRRCERCGQLCAGHFPEAALCFAAAALPAGRTAPAFAAYRIADPVGRVLRQVVSCKHICNAFRRAAHPRNGMREKLHPRTGQSGEIRFRVIPLHQCVREISCRQEQKEQAAEQKADKDRGCLHRLSGEQQPEAARRRQNGKQRAAVSAGEIARRKPRGREHGGKSRIFRSGEQQSTGCECPADHAAGGAVSPCGAQNKKSGKDRAEVQHEQPQRAERRQRNGKADGKGQRIGRMQPQGQPVRTAPEDRARTERQQRGTQSAGQQDQPVSQTDQSAETENQRGEQRASACKCSRPQRIAPAAEQPADQDGQRE